MKDKSINKNFNDYKNNKFDNDIIIQKKDDDYDYVEMNNSELLPRDIIYLKRGDFVPSDRIILGGDCCKWSGTQ